MQEREEPNAGNPDPSARGGEESTPGDAQKGRAAPIKRRGLRRLLLVLGPAAVLGVGAYVYFAGGRYVSTDDAFIKANKVIVSPQISGPIAEVLVHENQHVDAGDLLFRIDEQPFRIAVQRAEAQLRSVREDIESLEASYGQNTEQLDLARANEAFAKREFDRASALAKQKLASDFALDQAQHSLDVARQQVRVTEQQIAQIRAKLGGDPHGPISRQARYLEAKAALESAKLNLRHANVLAPFAGVASKVPLPGQYVTAGNAVMSVVADTGVWIEANYKETELTNVRPHQPVSIELDTYPGRSWGGEVQSISQATGAEFAIIPPQNATGNWVKVIQRIPVRIAVHNEAGDPPLRAGMSASVSIDTGHRRTWSSLIHALTPFSSTRGGTDGSSPGARE